mmetsp:Transcript_25548/g.64143  ORF Transcript_25548/g.64143 Transcript_25548/m.64143 type:complete len:208 (+) Transcript_25548:185-808(+)
MIAITVFPGFTGIHTKHPRLGDFTGTDQQESVWMSACTLDEASKTASIGAGGEDHNGIVNRTDGRKKLIHSFPVGFAENGRRRTREPRTIVQLMSGFVHLIQQSARLSVQIVDVLLGYRLREGVLEQSGAIHLVAEPGDGVLELVTRGGLEQLAVNQGEQTESHTIEDLAALGQVAVENAQHHWHGKMAHEQTSEPVGCVLTRFEAK